MTRKTSFTLECDVLNCTTRPVKLNHSAEAIHNWTQVHRTVRGSWTNDRYMILADLCPQHRGYKFREKEE